MTHHYINAAKLIQSLLECRFYVCFLGNIELDSEVVLKPISETLSGIEE
jgi:hypothetical protein